MTATDDPGSTPKPGHGATPTGVPAPSETSPTVPRAAAARLAEILASGNTERLRQWLDITAEAGLLAPPEALPELLTAAVPKRQLPDLVAALADSWKTTHRVYERRLPELVAAVAGERGRWLAAQQPSWSQVVVPAGVDPERDPEGWLRGETPAERLTWLRAARAENAAASRELVAATWSSELVAIRRGVVELIRDEPDPPTQDAALLQQASSDRSAAVRHAAAEALSRLPDSSFAQEVAAAGLPFVTVVDDGGTPRLEVRRDPDLLLNSDRWSTMLRGHDKPAAVLEAVFAHIPLQAWEERFGLTARELADVPIRGEADEALAPGGQRAPLDRRLAREALAWGWRRAALTQRNAEWAEACFSARLVWGGRYYEDAVLLRVVPRTRRARLVAPWVSDMVPDEHGRAMLDLCPAPWPPELWQAVVRRLFSPSSTRTATRIMLGVATAKVDVEAMADLRERATTLPPEHPVNQGIDRMVAETALLATIRAENLADAHQEGP